MINYVISRLSRILLLLILLYESGVENITFADLVWISFKIGHELFWTRKLLHFIFPFQIGSLLFIDFFMNQVPRMLLSVASVWISVAKLIMKYFQHKKVAAIFPFFSNKVIFTESLFGWKKQLQLLFSSCLDNYIDREIMTQKTWMQNVNAWMNIQVRIWLIPFTYKFCSSTEILIP